MSQKIRQEKLWTISIIYEINSCKYFLTYILEQYAQRNHTRKTISSLYV